MKKVFFFATTAVLLAGCSSNDLVDSFHNTDLRNSTEAPIGFNVQKQNITRNANLESVKHYNFGVWAWKIQGKNGLADAEVMNNYLVGWSNGSNQGYDKTNATTWAASTSGEADHTSPWFYEGLGTAEYLAAGTGYYQPSQTAYMSNNANQFLRYWDLAYAKTNFYCYAPYKKNATAGTNDIVFTKNATATQSTMVFDDAKSIRDGYDEPQNSAYSAFDRSLSEYMYAGVQADNSDLADVTIPFKHMGAQLFIRFYEDIPGYRVEIIDLEEDHGALATGFTSGTDIVRGIQATPAIAGTPNTAGTYYTTQGGTVTFTESNANASYVPSWTSAITAGTTQPLMFKIPQEGLSTSATAPANLTTYNGNHLNSTDALTAAQAAAYNAALSPATAKVAGDVLTTTEAAAYNATVTYKVIPEAATSGVQTYSYSPTIYYPVAQPTTSKTGFTFHVSYRIIAEDNKEVTTVHNATVHVPYKGAVTTNNETTPATASSDTNVSDGTNYYITVWRPNVKYTYTFKITRDSSGTTDPDTKIDPTDPTVDSKVALYPIVFDEATVEDFSTNYSVYEISEGSSTSY